MPESQRISFPTPNLTLCIIYIMKGKVAADFDVLFSVVLSVQKYCTYYLWFILILFLWIKLFKHRLFLHLLCRLWLQSYHILTYLITNSNFLYNIRDLPPYKFESPSYNEVGIKPKVNDSHHTPPSIIFHILQTKFLNKICVIYEKSITTRIFKTIRLALLVSINVPKVVP
jgi:hypothetical protein